MMARNAAIRPWPLLSPLLLDVSLPVPQLLPKILLKVFLSPLGTGAGETSAAAAASCCCATEGVPGASTDMLVLWLL